MAVKSHLKHLRGLLKQFRPQKETKKKLRKVKNFLPAFSWKTQECYRLFCITKRRLSSLQTVAVRKGCSQVEAVPNPGKS